MDYKNFTFLRQEEQIRNWYKNDLVITSSALEEANKNEFSIDSDLRELGNLLRQLYILLDEYPNALWWENAYKKAESLVKYARKREIDFSRCYSYYNKEQYTDVDTGNIVKSNYGIRIMPSSNGKNIIIVQYDTNLNMEIMRKNELRNWKIKIIKLVLKKPCHKDTAFIVCKFYLSVFVYFVAFNNCVV